ncbi:MAG: serine acetyltransferase [Phocaeicola sp.]
MKKQKSKNIIFDDLYRYCGNYSLKSFLRYFLFTPGYRYIVIFRLTQNASNLITRTFFLLFLRIHSIMYGIQIPHQTKIDRGFRIAHFGTIVINPAAKIGKNFNIANGAVVGNAAGNRKGCPTIGNNVSINANAIVVGGITIGNDVLIAPNAFVNFDVPDGALVIGNPGIIKKREKASAEYLVYKI